MQGLVLWAGPCPCLARVSCCVHDGQQSLLSALGPSGLHLCVLCCSLGGVCVWKGASCERGRGADPCTACTTLAAPSSRPRPSSQAAHRLVRGTLCQLWQAGVVRCRGVCGWKIAGPTPRISAHATSCHGPCPSAPQSEDAVTAKDTPLKRVGSKPSVVHEGRSHSQPLAGVRAAGLETCSPGATAAAACCRFCLHEALDLAIAASAADRSPRHPSQPSKAFPRHVWHSGLALRRRPVLLRREVQARNPA
jgi:hypothetical protein